MIQYIYFVKCPNCDDEPFDFFDEAKEFALGCLSNKPIITQVEVNRNDFGECTDSADLGTVWSWEDMMSDVPSGDELSVFTKDDLKVYDPECDPEFDCLDNSLDCVPDNFRKPISENRSVLAATRAPKDSDYIIVSKHTDGSYSFFGNNYRMTRQLDKAMTYSGKTDAEYDIKYAEDQAEGLRTVNDNYTYNPFFITTFGEAKKLVNDSEEAAKQRAAKTASYEARNQEVMNLAMEMYDRGDYCKSYEEFASFMAANTNIKPNKDLYYTYYRKALVRYAKERGGLEAQRAVTDRSRKPIPEGMTIEQLVEEMEENEDMVECTWCNDLFDKSECRKEVDLGWLCDRCQAAIMSRGEPLTFRENDYWDFLDESANDPLNNI